MPKKRLVPKGNNVVVFNDSYGVLALAAVAAVGKSANSKLNWFERLKQHWHARIESPSTSISVMSHSGAYDEDHSGSVFVCLDAYDCIYRLFYSRGF